MTFLQRDQYGRVFCWSDATQRYVPAPQSSTSSSESTLAAFQRLSLGASSSADADRRRRQILHNGYAPEENPRAYFTFGTVFCILAAVGSGPGAVDRASQITPLESSGDAPQIQIRRLVVIREGTTQCDAIPINTYFGRGVSHQGVVKSDHTVIFTGKDPPQLHPDEHPKQQELGMRPEYIRVKTRSLTDKLSPSSRLNYGKIYTIQHSAPVKAFGRVADNCLGRLESNFRSVWFSGNRSLWKTAPSVSSAAVTNSTIVPPSVADTAILARSMPERFVIDLPPRSANGYERMQDPDNFFTIGRVFSIMWVPREAEETRNISRFELSQWFDASGRPLRIHQTRRRYVVIVPGEPGSGFCSALPIQTYDGLGASDPDVVTAHHGIIHTGNSPRMLPGEAGMQRIPIQVVNYQIDERLDDTARINYRQIYRVYHDIAVQNFGVVTPRTIPALWAQFRALWQRDRPDLPVEPPMPSGSYGRPIQAASSSAGQAASRSSALSPSRRAVQERALYLQRRNQASHQESDKDEDESDDEDEDDGEEDEESNEDDEEDDDDEDDNEEDDEEEEQQNVRRPIAIPGRGNARYR